MNMRGSFHFLRLPDLRRPHLFFRWSRDTIASYSAASGASEWAGSDSTPKGLNMKTTNKRGAIAAVLSGAIVPTAAALLSLAPSPVHASITMSLTPLGTPASGYTSYMLTLTADPGQLITAV